MNVLNYGEESVSVALEEIEPGAWMDHVYKPDILGKPLATRRFSRDIVVHRLPAQRPPKTDGGSDTTGDSRKTAGTIRQVRG